MSYLSCSSSESSRIVEGAGIVAVLDYFCMLHPVNSFSIVQIQPATLIVYDVQSAGDWASLPVRRSRRRALYLLPIFQHVLPPRFRVNF